MINVIAIDGPTSSGKSSVGFLFSQTIGYQFIDTGLIYRMAALLVLRHKLLLNESDKIAEVLAAAKLEFKNNQLGNRVYLNEHDVTDLLHSPKVTKIVADVAAMSKVREIAKVIQRRLGEKENTVMMGRDIGSEIFPEAKLKFIITATVETRARRRYEQMLHKGLKITYEQILEEVKERDLKDSTRKVSPYRIPAGAIIIDTSDKTIEESAAELLKYFNENH